MSSVFTRLKENCDVAGIHQLCIQTFCYINIFVKEWCRQFKQYFENKKEKNIQFLKYMEKGFVVISGVYV